MSAARPDLEIVEHVPGERLVLMAPPSGLGHTLSEIGASIGRGVTSFTKEIRQRPRSPRGLVGFVGMLLLGLALGALVLLACFLVVVGAALVVVLYAMGVWLVAWALVPAAARHVLDRQSARRSHARLSSLSLSRDTGAIRWSGATAGACSFASLCSARLSIRPELGATSDLVLQLAGPEEAPPLRFSVARVDREAEALDLCMRMARVLGWGAYAATRDRLQGIEIELRPALPGERSHPFRGHAGSPRFHPIPERALTETDWDPSLETEFREPASPLPTFTTAAFPSVNVDRWIPGSVVTLRGGRKIGTKRSLSAMAAATSAALALPLSVLVLINGAGSLCFLETQLDGRLSFAGVMELLTRCSAILGWAVALFVVVRRTGKRASTFDWGSKKLTIHEDEGVSVAGFDQIGALVLTETSERRYRVSAALAEGSPRLLLESEPDAAPEAYLALTVDLARALGVAWRCTTDLP